MEKYNSFRRRSTLENPGFKKKLFRSITRTIGPWLPKSKSVGILDIACGEGSLLTFLRENGYQNLAGFDYSQENVSICHHLGLDFVLQGDALEIKKLYPDNQFDQVFVIDFLEHLPKEKILVFLESIVKLVNPGGSIVIQTPNMGSLFGLFHRYSDLSHEIGFTEKSIIDLMLMAGFSIEDITLKPSWNAATLIGRVREYYMRFLHFLVFIAEDSSRPKIPTKNLLIRGIVR